MTGCIHARQGFWVGSGCPAGPQARPAGQLRLGPAGLRPAAPPLRRPSLRSPAPPFSLSLGSAGGLDSGQAEPHAVDPADRRAPAAVRRPAVARVDVPAPA